MKDVFVDIYKNKKWDGNELFYSGEGSRCAPVVDPYIFALESFIYRLGYKPTAVDLGCGDFYVGSKTLPLFSKYTACDIVDELITHHKQKYSYLNVEFKQLNICKDELPIAEVGIVRQVLQHLSNDDICNFVSKVKKSFKYLICTEHLPFGQFKPNLDKNSDSNIRINVGSGVDLAAEPFNLNPTKEWNICSVPGVPVACGGVITTKLYQF